MCCIRQQLRGNGRRGTGFDLRWCRCGQPVDGWRFYRRRSRRGGGRLLEPGNDSCPAEESPVWFKTFEYNAQDAAGNQRDVELDQTLPQIISIGAAYHGFERTTIAVDVRYLDYRNTTLWGDSIPSPGLAWDSIFAVAVGAERQLTDRLAVRIGYLANENPIPDVATLFNIQLPTINRQQISVGGGLKLTSAITLDTAIIYGFHSSISGLAPLPGGGGQAHVGLSQDFISGVFGLRFEY